MRKEMHELLVYTHDKERLIYIDQPNPMASEQLPVQISPEQVPVLIQWLKEAQAEFDEPAAEPARNGVHAEN